MKISSKILVLLLMIFVFCSILLFLLFDKTTQLNFFHDISLLKMRNYEAALFALYCFLAATILISIVFLFVTRIVFKRWINKLVSFIKGGSFTKDNKIDLPSEFNSLIDELSGMIKRLGPEKKQEYEFRTSWTSKSIKEILNKGLSNNEVIVVSNREPYIHNWKDGKVEIQFPASGLVTALEPIVRSCSGIWIAHGSGTADKSVVDKYDKVKVPPDEPAYQIRRIWLTQEEENDYYYGFSNEGLWPLCHIAHVRPVFRERHWQNYKAVNKKFADAVLEEVKTKNPIILIQDYHFAVLPKLIREHLPDAIVLMFWHIPWPNSEKFGICPWRQEIIEGMLSSNIIGFHTKYHCNNFIETVDRFVECRIDREFNNVVYKGKTCEVNSYPISIEWPLQTQKKSSLINESRQKIFQMHQFNSDMKIGIGVDRLDYTKGLLERFLAIDRFLELNPAWIGLFTFVQIASPSRSKIDQYKLFQDQVFNLVEKVNKKYSFRNYVPILLKLEYHSPNEVYEYYRGSHFCFVSSLHDGMNLVAKEYISCREDELGVLILSQFAGAAKELSEAIIVNPYDIESCSYSIYQALNMSTAEQKARMSSMRSQIKECNIYKWAGKMLLDASVIKKKILIKNSIL